MAKKREPTKANKLVAFIAQRKASSDGVELPKDFWKDPLWKKFYGAQISRANALLKMYPEVAIYAALNKNTNIFSLHAKWLPSLIETEVINLNKIVQNNIKDSSKEPIEQTRLSIPKNNLKNKLD